MSSMTGPGFVDSNVLIYARDSSEPAKQARAALWLDWLWRTRTGRLSVQVLNEFYTTVTRRLTPGLSTGFARADVNNYLRSRSWSPSVIDRRIIEAAWSVEDRYGFSWWDSLIVASAQRAGCEFLLTEDLQHGQRLDGLTIVSPFEMTPDHVFS